MGWLLLLDWLAADGGSIVADGQVTYGPEFSWDPRKRGRRLAAPAATQVTGDLECLRPLILVF
jgi:hypothetical protein